MLRDDPFSINEACSWYADETESPLLRYRCFKLGDDTTSFPSTRENGVLGFKDFTGAL